MSPRVPVPSQDTVAARLGIRVADVLTLPRFRSEPAEQPLRRERTRRHKPALEADAVLDRYLLDARAGVADVLIAKKTGLPAEVVRYWRRRRCVRGRSGRTPLHLDAELFLRSIRGEPVDPVSHAVRGGRRGFEVPPYVLRIPLDYGELAAVVARLHADGLHVSRLSAALGIAETDLLVALTYFQAAKQR